MYVVITGVVIAGGYFLVSKKSPATNTEESLTEETETKNEQGKKMAFSDFMRLDDRSYKCEVKQALSDMENSGVVYMDGGMLRGEFNTIAEGREIDTTFIVRDGYSYTWSSIMPTMGFKVKVEQKAPGDINATSSGTYSFNAEQIGDYNCEEWTGTAATFEVPSNIKFQTVGS